MPHQNPTPPTSLGAAIAAWNENVRESSVQVHEDIVSAIRALQQLQSALRHYTEMDAGGAEADTVADPDPGVDTVPRLRALCGRVDAFQRELAELRAQSQAVVAHGEALVRDYVDLLDRHDGAPDGSGRAGLQLRLAEWNDGGDNGVPYADAHVLDQLIEAQKAEIAELNCQLAGLEKSLEGGAVVKQMELQRLSSQVEMQNIKEFLANSPIASVPVHASYFERILEAARSPGGHRVPMGAILISAGVITERQLESALGHQKDGRRRALGQLLVDLGYTTENAIAQTLAAQLDLPYVVLDQEVIVTSAVRAIPVHLARRHSCIPINFSDFSLFVAMANPLDLIALEDLRIVAARPIRPCVASRADIIEQIHQRYR